MLKSYDGAQVIDGAGDRIGTVVRTYVDDQEVLQFFEVKLGGLIPRHRLVPAAEIEPGEGEVRLPFIRDVIEEAPHIDIDDTLTAQSLDGVRAYYAANGSLDAPPVDPPLRADPVPVEQTMEGTHDADPEDDLGEDTDEVPVLHESSAGSATSPDAVNTTAHAP